MSRLYTFVTAAKSEKAGPALRGATVTLRTKRPVVAFETSRKAPMQQNTWFDFYEARAVLREQLAQGLTDRAIDARLKG